MGGRPPSGGIGGLDPSWGGGQSGGTSPSGGTGPSGLGEITLGSESPAILYISSSGGSDFNRPERKFAVEVLPSLPSPPSHTVTLSIFTPEMALTCSATIVSSLSAMSRRTASGAVPALLTRASIPSACLVSFSRTPRASASIFTNIASASPCAFLRVCSAMASASISSLRFSMSAATIMSASLVAFSRAARATSAACSAE